MKKFVYLILLLSIIGAAISAVLVFQHYYPDSDFSALSCGDAIENPCIAVGQSDYSKFMGIPLAAFGLFFYLVIMFILLIADYAEANYYKISCFLLLPLIALSLFIDMILAGLLVKIGEICFLCVSTYLINIGLFIVSYFWAKELASKESRSLFSIYKDIKQIQIDTPEKKVALSSFTLFLILLTFSLFSSTHILKIKTTDPRINKDSIRHYLKDFYSKPAEHFNHPQNGLVIGDPDAKITIHAYTDFLCSYCYKFYKMEKYLLSKHRGKINMVYYNFPLEIECNSAVKRTIYKNSCLASLSFFAASKLGVFEDYLVQHFKNYKAYKHNYHLKTVFYNLSRVLKENNKDVSETQLLEMLNSEESKIMLQDHIEYAKTNHVHGTPTIFIANRLLDGLPPKEIFDSIIKIELKKLEKR